MTSSARKQMFASTYLKDLPPMPSHSLLKAPTIHPEPQRASGLSPGVKIEPNEHLPRTESILDLNPFS
jgi:hypothetical protein